jgi:hypothetical protein
MDLIGLGEVDSTGSVIAKRPKSWPQAAHRELIGAYPSEVRRADAAGGIPNRHAAARNPGKRFRTACPSLQDAVNHCSRYNYQTVTETGSEAETAHRLL